MSEQASQAVLPVKKKNKRKKKKAGKAEGGSAGNDGQPEAAEQVPKQTSEKDNQIITTAKCSRCKGLFRRFGAVITPLNWMCPSCMHAVKDEEKFAPIVPPSDSSTFTSSALEVQRSMKESQSSSTTSRGCNCAACLAKRENAVPPEVERDAHITQTYWMEIRHIVRCIYRDNMSLASPSNRSTIGSEKMRSIVKKLCSKDPHQFFQRLETLAREYLLEVKVRLLEQLSCGFNSPQLAIEFIQMLLDEYSTLCNALPSLLYLLEPLEESEYYQRLGMTIELMNKNIFRELIFAEAFMSSNLPLIIAQLRLASLSSDPYHRSTADALSQRYVSLDREMEDICRVWRSAKEQLNSCEEERRLHLEKIKADGESFRQMKHQLQQEGEEAEDRSPETPDTGKSKLPGEAPPPDPAPSTTSPTSSPADKSLPSTTDDSVPSRNSQLAEWTKLLFQCIKPVGEPEFRLNGDIATHTITLRLDMTELDLSHARATCTRDELRRYQTLGLALEEVVEVSMKLNTLKTLGINLQIEDLFDDEGFSLADVNNTLLGDQVLSDDLYFLEDGATPLGSKCTSRQREAGQGAGLSGREIVDLKRAEDLVLHRQDPGVHRNDFLQGMTMKIRFMKRLTVDDLEKNFMADGGRVMFNACDQVQMKLTQLELNSLRLATNSDCVGSDIGLEQEVGDPVPPVQELNESTREDYGFIHTESHRQFMDLLLEKRKQLENNVSAKQREKRDAGRRKDEGKKAEADQRYGEPASSSSANGSSTKTALANMTKLPEPQELPGGFKPVFLPNSSQPCQCSACVGAMAAHITGDVRRPLNPTDPSISGVTIESCLTTHLAGDKGREERLKQMRKGSGGSLASKEGVWQNWMSTSSATQLESESPFASETPSHAQPHPPHSHSHYQSGGTDGDSGYGDSLKSCSHACDCHDHSHSAVNAANYSSYSSPYSAPHNHAPPGSSPNYCGSTANGAVPGSGEMPRRYCPCCYCELFGHNGPPTAPTSHNFTKQRDKMRAKLEEKKKKKDGDPFKGDASGMSSDVRPVDELLAFIEGEENEPQVSARAAKRQRRKQRKHALSTQVEEQENSTPTQSSPTSTQIVTNFRSQNGSAMAEVHVAEQVVTHKSNGAKKATQKDEERRIRGGRKDGYATEELSQRSSRRVQGRAEKGRTGRGVHRMLLGQSNGTDDFGRSEADLLNNEEDEYDDELEAFKQFCFAPAPVENRKKIAVSLNMQDIMSKIK